MIYLIIPYRHKQYDKTPLESMFEKMGIQYTRFHKRDTFSESIENTKLLNSDCVIFDDSQIITRHGKSTTPITFGAKKQIQFCLDNDMPVYYLSSAFNFGKIESITESDRIYIGQWFHMDSLCLEHNISNNRYKDVYHDEYVKQFGKITKEESIGSVHLSQPINYLLISTGLGV